MNSLTKRVTNLALVLALFCMTLPFSSRAAQTSLAPGDRGDEVIQLKIRLFDLGYLRSVKDISDRYSEDTKSLVQAFQQANKLQPTGEADTQTLSLLYSPDAIKASLPEDRPRYNITPDAFYTVTPVDLPPLDSRGFLQAIGEPYVYKNREAGYWLYLTNQMKVTITRYNQSQGQIEWFEVYIKYKDEGKPMSIESKRNGAMPESPIKMAEAAGAVCAINDDYYRYRVNKNQRTGIVLRDGLIMADRTYTQKRSRIPSLEVMALFSDGTLTTFASDAYTAQEYINMGVTDTWAFGPALVQEGEVPRYFYSKDYRSYREPRTAFGMTAPGEYCALVITGRKDSSRGATFGWMAEKMAEMGAKEALNLDGGGSVALVFMGELLNKATSNQTARPVSGIIGFK